MKTQPHPQFKALQELIATNETILHRRWKGLAYRCTSMAYASTKKLLTGEGTRQYGARWMGPHEERVVHLSLTETTALKESKRHFVQYQIDGLLPEPRVLIALQVEITKMLDLYRLDSLNSPFTIAGMLDDDWETTNAHGRESLSQALGRAAFSLRYEAILAPSAIYRTRRNLVYFPENLSYRSRVTIAHENTLRQWLG